MAAPESVNVHNMNASYDLNKKISNSTADMLKMQGLPWLVRQAANYSAIQVNLKQYPDEADPQLIHLDQEQISTGGVTQLEPRIMDGETRERDIQYWGQVKGWNKYVKLDEVADEDAAFLKEGWNKECQEGDVILGYTESVGGGWMAIQVWGFADIDDQRRHVRRIVSRKGKETHKIRLVYDYKS